jgi:hypothetical protein
LEREQSRDGLEDVHRVVLGKPQRLAVQSKAQCLARKVLADGPVAGLQEHSKPRLVATEHVAVQLDELRVPIGHHRIAPVDDPGEAAVLDERVGREGCVASIRSFVGTSLYIRTSFASV